MPRLAPARRCLPPAPRAALRAAPPRASTQYRRPADLVRRRRLRCALTPQRRCCALRATRRVAVAAAAASWKLTWQAGRPPETPSSSQASCAAAGVAPRVPVGALRRSWCCMPRHWRRVDQKLTRRQTRLHRHPGFPQPTRFRSGRHIGARMRRVRWPRVTPWLLRCALRCTAWRLPSWHSRSRLRAGCQAAARAGSACAARRMCCCAAMPAQAKARCCAGLRAWLAAPPSPRVRHAPPPAWPRRRCATVPAGRSRRARLCARTAALRLWMTWAHSRWRSATRCTRPSRRNASPAPKQAYAPACPAHARCWPPATPRPALPQPPTWRRVPAWRRRCSLASTLSSASQTARPAAGADRSMPRALMRCWAWRRVEWLQPAWRRGPQPLPRATWPRCATCWHRSWRQRRR